MVKEKGNLEIRGFITGIYNLLHGQTLFSGVGEGRLLIIE